MLVLARSLAAAQHVSTQSGLRPMRRPPVALRRPAHCRGPAVSRRLGLNTRRAVTTLRCQASGEQSEEAELQPQENSEAVKEAAKFVVDNYIRDGMVVGMGSAGPAARAAIQYISKQLESGRLKNIKAVPLSHVAATEISFWGIPLSSQLGNVAVDVAFDYVDEADEMEGTLPVIKGRRNVPVQPNVAAEKAVLDNAKLFLAFADEENVVNQLGGVLPVMIEGEHWEGVAEELDDMFLGDASIWRRGESSSAPPHGGDNPYITAEGRNVLDIIFEGPIKYAYRDVAASIETVPYVAAHGLYLDKVHSVVAIDDDGYRTIAPYLKTSRQPSESEQKAE